MLLRGMRTFAAYQTRPSLPAFRCYLAPPSMLGISNLGKSFGGRTLFESVSVQLNAGSRYGLVGANGSGKTTLLKILAGDEPATEGTFSLQKGARMGVLRQDRFLDDAMPILDVAMQGDEAVHRALRKMQSHPEEAHELEEFVRQNEGYTLEARASSVLEGLGIPVPLHRNALGTLSGGFKLRVLLAQVLLGRPDLLLLDEPTNHLDILSIRWLEKFLVKYEGCAVVISHDQRFLDNVSSHILDVDYGTLTLYHGNFTRFLVQKEETRTRKEGELARMEKIVEEKKAFVARFKAKATKARQAQSRQKQLEKIEDKMEDVPESSRRTPHFSFTPLRQSGREVLTVEHVSKAYGDKRVLTDVSLTVRRGEKVAVIGPNGLGKSTLLKIIVGALEADQGKVEWGHETRVGYFAQDHHEILKDTKSTPLQFIEQAVPMEPTAWVRGQLGRVLFSRDDVMKPVGKLSGGEAARLIFCRLAVEKPNVLVLDEPTNHLDMEAIGALADAVRSYTGTVVFVSHDRWFVSELATRVVEITAEGPRDFPGSYAEYLARLGDDHLDADVVVSRAKAEKRSKDDAAPASQSSAPKPSSLAPPRPAAPQNAPSTPPASSAPKSAPPKPAQPNLSWEEQKRRKNRAKALPKERDDLLAQIDKLEARKKEIEQLYASADFSEKHTPQQVRGLQYEEADLARSLEALVQKWEKVEEELAALGAD